MVHMSLRLQGYIGGVAGCALLSLVMNSFSIQHTSVYMHVGMRTYMPYKHLKMQHSYFVSTGRS